MGYRLNCLDEPVLMAVSKPMQTEFGIHHRLESCGRKSQFSVMKWYDGKLLSNTLNGGKLDLVEFSCRFSPSKKLHY